MSRKSKLAISRERLVEISNVPDDLFEKLDNMDALLETVIRAEGGDLEAAHELMKIAFDTYGNDAELNRAMLYLAMHGIELGDVYSAECLIHCINKYNDGYDSLDKAIELMKSSDRYDLVSRQINQAMLRRIVTSATPDSDFDELYSLVASLNVEYIACIELYLYCLEKLYTGRGDEEKLNRLKTEVGIEGILSIPAFDGDGERRNDITPEVIARDINNLKNALVACDIDIWRGFWIRCIFEYMEIYAHGSYYDVVNEIIYAISRRKYSKRRKQHLLASIRYALTNPDITDAERTSLIEREQELVNECIYDGDCPDDNYDTTVALMREGVYTSEYQARKAFMYEKQFGIKIHHTKNRYMLTADLTGHAKRGNKHMWEIVISMPIPNGEEIRFTELNTGEVRTTVIRNGISLPYEKTRSQMLIYSELLINGSAHPFELDLMLDISYVSAAKCGKGEIKVRKSDIIDNHLVMRCQLYIF